MSLYAYRAGAGPPLVCVHGLGVTSTYFEPFARVLAPARRVLVPDLPGWGRSPRPPRALDVDELVDALVSFLDAEELDRVPLVANSFGCQLVVELAIRAPERVAALVLVGPTVDPRRRPLRVFIPAFLLDCLREPPSIWLVILRDYLWMGPRRFAQTARHAWRHRIEERLPSVAAPTLVVRGARDGFVTQGWCEEAASLLPRGSLAVVDAPHDVHYAEPRTLSRLVLGFLEEVEHDARER